MEAVTYTTQNLWTWWFAIYLFLGGMGAAIVTVSFMTDMYIKPHKTLAVWGGLAGVIMLTSGTLLLFAHLLHHAAVIYLLTPTLVISSPHSWIAWGTQFIIWVQVAAVLYILPYAMETPLQNMPLVGVLLKLNITKTIARFATKFHRFLGWVAALCGFGTAIYTGLLLQSFPSVTLWHNPGLPVLFTVSAFSTALAFLMVVMHLYFPRAEDKQLLTWFERTDVALIAMELIIIFAFFHYTLSGSEGGYRSAAILWGDKGWLIGFIGFGLLVPLALEFKGVIKGWATHTPIIIASILVMGGGYLLRHYFMAAGIYAYPW